MAGTNIEFLGPQLVSNEPLVVAELGGETIGRPEGRFRFVGPQLLGDAHGQLHLVWGEPENATTAISAREWMTQTVTSLWTAEFTSQRGWTPARRLYLGPALNWKSATYVDGDGRGAFTLHPALPNSGPGVTEVVHFDGDHLVASAIPTFRTPAYSSLLSVGPVMYFAFVAAAPDGAADQNSVYLQRSLDGGNSWQKERLISRSGMQPASQLRMHSTPDGQLHLLWLQKQSGAGTVIRHVRSADGGHSWSQPDDLTIASALFSNLISASDECGTIHVVNEHATAESMYPQLDYVTWNGQWSRVEHLFPSVRVGATTLQRSPDGRLRLAFVAQPSGTPMNAPTTVVYSERGHSGPQ